MDGRSPCTAVIDGNKVCYQSDCTICNDWMDSSMSMIYGCRLVELLRQIKFGQLDACMDQDAVNALRSGLHVAVNSIASHFGMSSSDFAEFADVKLEKWRTED